MGREPNLRQLLPLYVTLSNDYGTNLIPGNTKPTNYARFKKSKIGGNLRFSGFNQNLNTF